MYKFTNGIVVFDKETRDAYIKAGMHLVEEKKVNEGSKETDILVDQKGNDEVTISTKENRKELREKR